VIREAVYAKADGLLLSAGQAKRFVKQYGRGYLPPYIIRTDWTNLLRLRRDRTENSLLPVDGVEYRRLISASEVLYIHGGSAAIGFLFVDPNGKLEDLTIRASQELIEECHEIGLPCIIEVLAILTDTAQADPAEMLMRGIRKALELGADALKIPITKEIAALSTAIHQAEKRFFVLGGSNLADEELFLSLMRQAITAGADGLLVGRNVSKSKNPGNLIARLQEVVHGS
jgi:class I fructose-bisphosphate aldolase